MLFTFLRRLVGRPGGRIDLEEAQGRRAIVQLSVYLAAIGALHVAAMMVFEGLSLGDSAWLTMTTVTTVGYGDISAASTAGRFSTVVLIYAGGIFALAKGAGDYFDYRAARRQRMIKGGWRWNMKDHVLLIHAPRAGAEPYFETLVQQFRETEWGRERPVLILTEAWPDGLPSALRRIGIVHVHGRGSAQEALALADADRAAVVMVLAGDHRDPKSDSVAFDLVHRLREMNPECRVLVECVDDRNRRRLREAGAAAVMRPMRGYPEMMVRAVVAPGSEYIIENLFTARGDECVRYEVAVEGVSWGRLASELILKGVGTPIAFADAGDGAIECNPPAADRIDAKALYIMAKEGHVRPDEQVRRMVREIALSDPEASASPS